MSDLSKINVNSTEYDLKDAKAYSTRDSAETTIDDADYIPFYDASADAKKKTLWSNVKAKLKTYFDTLYNSGLAIDSDGEIAATYGTSPEETDPILKDETGGEIATVLNSIATELQLLGQPEVYAPVIYSNTEREIGVWKDGKPLYQKTVLLAFTQNTGSVSKQYPHNIADVEKIWVYDATDNVNNPRPSAGNQYAVAITVTSSDIYVETGTDRHTLSSYITLRYTKTTDVAGSGLYAALGVPAVHYSTTEQVIGTWIDGKPLYQKTVDFGNLPNNTNKSVNHNISNIDKIVYMQATGMNLTAHGAISIPNVSNSSLNNMVVLSATSTQVTIGSKINVSVYYAYVTIQYTKTTD